MAEPLSISASIAGLVTIADTVFGRTFKYIKSVEQAPKEIAALSSEVGALYGILNHLRLIDCHLEGKTFEYAIEAKTIYSCKQTLEKVKTMLDKYDTLKIDRRSVDAMKRRLTWPFIVPETKSLIAEVERHKATLGLALTADGMMGLLTALSRQNELQNGVDEIRHQFRQRQEADTRIAIDNHRRKILDSFGPCNPDKNHKMSLKLRHPGTGLWLTESDDFKHWLNTPHSKLWLPGIPGAGKTVLASSVIQEALLASDPSVAVAFFYCDYKDVATQDPLNILGSLARQLARQNEKAFEKLENLYGKHFLDNKMTTEYEPEELRDLILDITSTFDSTLLLVDALDECGNNTSFVVELLASLNTNGTMSDVKSLFLSRDEQSIRDWLNDYCQISIAATSSDLKLYVGAEIDNRTRRNLLRLKDPSLKAHIMERLVSGAEGMFRWVTCQMDYLCELPTDYARKKALNSLPPTLDATYARILRRVKESNHDVQILVQRSLRWIAHAHGGLSVAGLCEAISVNPGDTFLNREDIPAEAEILRYCSSLIRRSTSDSSLSVPSLELAHFTVKEYLQKLDEVADSEFGAYHIQHLPCNIELAEVCLTYLNLDDFTQVDITNKEARTRRMKDYALRSYAVTNWLQHAKKNMANESVFRLVQQLFYPSKSNNFITWAQDYNYSSLLGKIGSNSESTFDAINIRLATTGPLHYAAILAIPELCTWLLDERCEVNQRSPCGTPLQCTVLGARALMAEIPAVSELWDYIDEDEDVMSTLTTLLDRGADPNCYHDDGEAKLSLLGIIAYLQWKYSCLKLLRHGAVVDEYARAQFQRWVGLSEDNSESILTELIGREDLGKDDYASILVRMLASDEFKTMNLSGSEKPVSELQYGAANDHLRLAAKFGQLGIINRLLANNSLDLNAAETDTGRTALHYAAENGHSDIVTLLLVHGADSNVVDSDGRTPVSLATKATESHCFLNLLRQGCDTNAKDLEGYTIVHQAAKESNIAALLALKEHLENSGAPGCSNAVEGTTTPLSAELDIAGEAEIHPIEQNFLQAISQKSADGKTPLHLAAEGGSLDILHFLLDSNCDSKALMNDGSTALHCVAGIGYPKDSHLDIMNVLLEHRVDPCHPRFDGATALHVMIYQMYPPWSDQSIRLKVLETLARQEESLLQTNAEGLTALHLLLRKCSDYLGGHDDTSEDDASEADASEADASEDDAARWARMLTLLLEAGADLQAKDAQNQSALYYLVSTFTATTTRLGLKTLSHMMSIAMDYVGEDETLIKIITDPALLALAIKFGQSELVQKLLDRSPEVDVKAATLPGMTPIQAACRYGCDRKNLLRLLDLSKARSDPAGLGSDLIRLACQRNDTEAYASALVLLEAGFDPSNRSSRGENALMLAARAGNVDIVKLLVGHGVDPSVSDAQGCNVAHCALEGGHVEVVYALRHCKLDWGAKGEISIHGHKFREVTALHLAAKHGDSSLLEYLIDERLISDIDCVTQSGETPLYIAVWFGQAHNVAVLLSKGANANTLGNGGYESPLHLAARFGNQEIVSEILRYGCDVTSPNKDGLDCEMIALKFGFKDLAQTFAEFAQKQVSGNVSTPAQGPKCTSKSPRASEALKVAIDVGDLELCKRIVEKGADLESGFTFCLGCTPLLYSLMMDEPEIAEFLVSNGASITGQTCRDWSTHGYTSLHYAARDGHFGLLKCLLNRGALELIDMRSFVHPIHLAVANGHTKCVEMILDRSYYEMGGNARSHGTSPEHLLINRPIDWSLMQWTLGVKSGVDLPVEFETSSPLQIAASSGCILLVESLLKRGASVNAIDQRGWTPLHFTAAAGHVSIIKMLLEFGANLHLRDRYSENACMRAASNDHLDAVRELLKAGTDRQAQNINHQHLLHYAAVRNSWNVFFYLLSSATTCELTMKDIWGSTVIVSVLEHAKPCQLLSLLNHALPDQAYFPQKSNVLTAAVMNFNMITSVLKRLLKRLSQSLLPQLLSHKDALVGTPLYAASIDVSPHQVKIICTLLDAGASLELEGGDHGTPLMGACAMGRLSAVKVLVSKGAKLHYIKDGSTIRALDKAKHFPEIKHWLLVGRYTEGPNLLMKDDTQSATPGLSQKVRAMLLLRGSEKIQIRVSLWCA